MLGTERIFADAIIFLCMDRKIHDVKMQELLQRAQAGRQTFYNHFENKYDLVRWIYTDYGTALDKIFSSGDSMALTFERLFSFFVDNSRFFTKLDNISSGDEFMEFLTERLKNYYAGLVVRAHGEAFLTREIMFAVDFNCDGFARGCLRWMRGGMRESAQTMAQRMINNMSPVLKKMTSM